MPTIAEIADARRLVHELCEPEQEQSYLFSCPDRKGETTEGLCVALHAQQFAFFQKTLNWYIRV